MKKAALFLVFVPLISLAVWTVGCAQIEAPPTLTLAIRNVELCSAVSEEGDYTVQPGATFDRGDDVWLYFEAYGMAVKRVDDKFECWIKFSELKIFDPNGNIVGHLVDLEEYHSADLDEAPDFSWFFGHYESTTDDPVGQYRWEFTVEDMLSRAIGTGAVNFTLK